MIPDKSLDERLQDICLQIKNKFSEIIICELIDEAIPNYTDSGWEEDFDDIYEWYAECGNGEAEDQVVQDICTWYARREPQLQEGILLFLRENYDVLKRT
jgi:hypothetical protein